MKKLDTLLNNLSDKFASKLLAVDSSYGEVTIEVDIENLKQVLTELKKFKDFQFNELIDICGVDYLLYGVDDWQTQSSTETGFSRGVERQPAVIKWDKPRFAVVYHLLSTTKNHRLRVKVFVEDNSNMIVPSVHEIWKAANWFEREAYDLYGILFDGHPDMRRILTDYGFIGHPFRKDFPMIGHVEMRYDATLQKVIYEPVDIQPRVVIPKVIRDDNRYKVGQVDEK